MSREHKAIIELKNVWETFESPEELAAMLEEAAARVRLWSPEQVQYAVTTDVEITDPGPHGESMVIESRPVRRMFDLRWPT